MKNLLLQTRFPTHLLFVFAICTLFCATSVQPAQADAAPPPDPSVGSAGPYQPQKTNVQMMAETVLIDVPEQKPPSPTSPEPPKVHVSASFTMRNQGKTEEKMQVIFPLSQLTWPTDEDSEYRVDRSSFVVRVDGKPVPTSEINTPAEEGYRYEYDEKSGEAIRGFRESVIWAAFDVTFPVHKTVVLQVEYDMGGYYDGFYQSRFEAINYILETGAGWYGKIMSADLILRLPYQATEEAIRYANPGYTLSGNEVRWHLKNIEPTRKDNLSVGVYSSETWRSLLELRAKVTQNPKDAETWNSLGDLYSSLGIRTRMMDTISYSVLNNHFANLAIDAYQKALALRSVWGDPHFKIAQILWAQNAGRRYFQLEDPAIQRVLSELNLGWTYGISRTIDTYTIQSLLMEINRHIPGLDLRVPPAPTVTMTPLSTPAATAQPTPMISPTPTQTQPAPTPTNIVTDNKGVVMRRVPAGRFIMGSKQATNGQDGEKLVYLDAFDIDQYEVTNALYQACVTAGKCARPKQVYSYTRPSYYGNSKFTNYPVVDVDWNMAAAYCAWRGTRLPTNSEWEKAARGADGRTYPWGETTDETYANYNLKIGDTSAVGSYPRGQSVYGVDDMAGNVWEWTADFYGDSYSSTHSWRFIKGGSWYNDDNVIDSSILLEAPPDYANLLIGFRCARSLPPAPGQNGRATPQPTATKFVDEKGVTMQVVPVGDFLMGNENGNANEKPVHKVFLDAFAIDRYEVTNTLYKACVTAGVCDSPKRTYGSASRNKYYNDPKFGNYPVIALDWNMSKAYCEWRGARLPTEAEWEKAARGTDGRSYPWGEGIDNTYANFNLNDTTAVGSYEKGKSIYGVYDMAGNVWEWVNDWYDEAYYQNSPSTNPLGPSTGQYHVLRGGSWYIADFGVRSAYRSFGTPNYTKVNIGFRCARSIP